MEPAIAQTYVHPDARTTVLPHVLNNLPSALIQENIINLPPSSTTVVLASYPPPTLPPPSHPWSVGVLDFSRPSETEFFFWCSEENLQVPDEDEQARVLRFRGAYPLFESMLAFIAEQHPEKEILLVGSLHVSLAPFVPKKHITSVTEVWAKVIFSRESLPPITPASQARAEEYTLEKVHEADLDDVCATSSVRRYKSTLARLSGTGAYLPGSNARAWCFTNIDGALTTLFVRPEERGRGLGKLVMRKELEKAYERRRFVSADVSLTNEVSTQLCASLGGRTVWETVWMGVSLEGFRRVQTGV